jgi:protein TonB
MKRARRLFWAVGFVLLFATPSLTSAQIGTPQASGTPDPDRIYSGKEVDKKVSIKRKPEPSYTQQALDHGVQGRVILRCIFSSTGQVTNIHVTAALPDGLTERAIEAAKKIKFKPAMKDGQPVSMWMELQYYFNP